MIKKFIYLAVLASALVIQWHGMSTHEQGIDFQVVLKGERRR